MVDGLDVALEQAGRSVDYRSFPYRLPVAVVVGQARRAPGGQVDQGDPQRRPPRPVVPCP